LRPNLGSDIARTGYTGAEITNQTFANSVLQGQTAVDLGSSWAPVFNAGIQYNISKN
jgi:outer membrane protein